MSSIFHFIPPSYYGTVYIYAILALCVAFIVRYSGSRGQQLLHKPERPPILAIVLAMALIVFMGFRQGLYNFGDSYFYAHTYENVIDGYSPIDFNSEWLFDNLMWLEKSSNFPVEYFFFTVEAVYLGCTLLACWRLFPNNVWLSMLFCLSSFGFYSYGVNGIRNGMAATMVMLAIALFLGSKKERIAAIVIMLMALGIHRSMMLPIAALVAATFFIKDPKVAINFWLASIVISLIAGNFIGDMFAELGFDDRMSSYFQGQDDEETMAQFSHTGFRFDFLLYSTMPIVMTWYCTIKRNFHDHVFNAIAITYILSNAFWVMVIRAAYSNRFAYLSWFLYPLVIVYPLLRFDLWNDQDAKTARILAVYAGFTYVMFLLGK
jgi:hypothetical protein